jgi:hypothetical protein
MKNKETLEEVAKSYIENTMRFSFNSLETKTQANRMLKCAEFGAKWQAERMYSEEEVMDLFRKYQYDLAQWVLRMEDDIGGKPIPTEWFEQFKKK